MISEISLTPGRSENDVQENEAEETESARDAVEVVEIFMNEK